LEANERKHVPHRHIFAVATLLVLAGWLSLPAIRSQAPIQLAAPKAADAPFPERPFQLLGAGSCASASCHNSGNTSQIKGNEYAISLTDKHDRAYEVLLEDRSKKILQKFHGLDDWRSAHAERDLLCIKCHVHLQIDRAAIKEVDGIRQFRLEDGVSCEACHGPAERWLDLHHRPQWQALSPADKKAHYGMQDMRGPLERARSCVPCHVGAPGMDVNHDLIAAGHPRLAFEFSSYHSLMIKHWDDARDRDPARGGNPDFEAHAWAGGQLIVLDAALELLRRRSESKVWPDFAEFDCYACHHDLRNPGARQDRDFAGRVAGRMPWNRWSTAQAETAHALLCGQSEPALTQGLQNIRQEMQSLAPRKDALNREIPKLRELLEKSLGSRDLAAVKVTDAMGQIARNTHSSWDDAAQTYAGLIAWERTRLDRRLPEIAGLRGNLETMRTLLLPDARYRLNDVGRITEKIANDLRNTNLR
jgi:hypothetical protein